MTDPVSAASAKAAIRVLILARRRTLSAASIAEASGAIQRRVLALAEFAAAQSVFCYLAMRQEVQTDLLVATCLKLGKRLCVPAYDRQRGQYAPAWLNESDALRVVPGKPPEPEVARWAALERLDLALVPGVAFDGCGARIGHGAGHYDALLKAPVRVGLKVGLAFDCQIVDRIPTEAHDVRMNAIVTEKTVYRVKE